MSHLGVSQFDIYTFFYSTSQTIPAIFYVDTFFNKSRVKSGVFLVCIRTDAMKESWLCFTKEFASNPPSLVKKSLTYI